MADAGRMNRLIGRTLVFGLLGIMAVGYAQTASPVPQPTAPPLEDSEAQALLASLAAEIEAVAPTIEPKAEPPATDPNEDEKSRAAAASELVESLKNYQSSLKEFLALRTQVRTLTDSSSIGRLSEELFRLHERLKEVQDRRDDRRPVVTEDELKEAEQAWRSANDDLMIRTAARSERLKGLADAENQKSAAEGEVQAAQSALLDETAQCEAKIASATQDSQRTAAKHRLRLAQLRVSTALLRQEQVKLEIERDTRLVEDNEQVIPTLRELSSALDDDLEKLKRTRVRSERQRIKDWVEFVQKYPDAVSAYERAYWPLRLTMVESLQELDLARDKAGILDRFPEEKYHDLMSDLSSELAIGNQFLASLDRRPREQIQERYRRLALRIREWQAKRDELRSMYDQSFDHRVEIELRLNELDADLQVRIRAAREATANDFADPKIAELRQAFAVEKQAFDEELQKIRSDVGKLSERLSEAGKAVSIHAETLSAFRSRLYWSYLTVNDQPLWKYQLSKSLDEWNTDSRRQKRQQDVAAIEGGFQKVTRVGWIALGVLVVVSVFPALRLRSKLRYKADALEEQVGQKLQEENLLLAPLSDRLHFQAMRFLAGTVPVLAPCVLAWWWVRLSPIDGRVARPLILFLAGVSVLWQLIHTVFGGSKPRFRLLPCSNVVARYYQRWLSAFLVLSVLLIPLPLSFAVLEWAFYSRSFMSAVYKTIMLILVLIFISRKQTILKIAGRAENVSHPFLLAVISAAYPLFYLFVLGLLAAQIAGYGALVTYLIAATTASVGTVVLAYLLLKYLFELSHRLQQRLRAAAEVDAAEAATDSQRTAALAAGREVVLVDTAAPFDGELPITILTSILRLGVWCAVLVLVLGYWGVSWVDLKGWMGVELIAASTGADGRPAVSVGRAGLAALVVCACWTLSRTLRSILDTKVFPSYSNLDRGGRVAVNTVIHYLLLLLGLYFAMFLMRIPLGAVTVVLGTLGLGLGLASQPLFMNFLSGLIMLFERHVKVGDMVEVDGVLGEVTNISIRATTIKTYDNVDMVVPNADFVGSKVVNWTLNDSRIRGKIALGVAYGTDPRKVERLLLQIAQESSLVLREPAPRVRFTEFGASSLDFTLYAWFRNVTDRWDFVTDARYRIVELFAENGIEIPYPQREFSFKEDHPLRIRVVNELEREAGRPT